MLKVINPIYNVYDKPYSIIKRLKDIENDANINELAFDCETRSIYSTKDKEEVKEALKKKEIVDQTELDIAELIKESSGLSYPSIVKVTHFMFSDSKNKADILIAKEENTELLIYNWMSRSNKTFLIWNALFDLKIMYSRIGKFPKRYEDPSLALKVLINNVDIFKSRTGLKLFMGKYYPTDWSVDVNYDVEDLLDEKFLRYCAIDAASTYYGWQLIKNAE